MSKLDGLDKDVIDFEVHLKAKTLLKEYRSTVALEKNGGVK